MNPGNWRRIVALLVSLFRKPLSAVAIVVALALVLAIVVAYRVPIGLVEYLIGYTPPAL